MKRHVSNTSTQFMSGKPESAETRAALLTDHNPLSVLDKLPSNVFPVRMKLGLPRPRGADTTDDTYKSPSYPVSVNQPSAPYIPEQTVHFDNPVERAPDKTTAWTPPEFREKLTEVLNHLEDDHPVVNTDTLTLQEIDIVEIPSHFLTTDSTTGDLVPKPDMYDRNGEMTMVRFAKEGSLSATNVRDSIKEALPGETRTPTRLTRIKEVQAKPFRHGRTTSVSGGRAQYYTETDAEKNNDLSLTPSVYQLDELNADGDQNRPLSMVLDSLEEFVPTLVNETDGLVSKVKFVGQEREHTVFHATEVLK